ncbi:MAG: hypothetical protein ACTSPO_01030, partial [Candidatus Heimdallarchaeaceae archaeon]
LAGPLLAGPLLAGPLLAGPLLAGPLLAGPLLAGPLLAERHQVGQPVDLLVDPLLVGHIQNPLLADPVEGHLREK